MDKVIDKVKDKEKLKSWIFQKCLENTEIRWSDVVNQEFLGKNDESHTLYLKNKVNFLELYQTIIELDEVIYETFKEYTENKIITLNCPSNPGYYWGKNDTIRFRVQIYDFLVLYVMKLTEEQVMSQFTILLSEYQQMYNMSVIYTEFIAKSNKNRVYLLYLITTLFLYQNESNKYRQDKFKKSSYSFMELVKKDFFCEGEQIFGETFGLEFDDEVRIYLLDMASKKYHIEASYELAEYYKIQINMGKAGYSWDDVISIYKRIEDIDESGKASWALGRIAEKGFISKGVDYVCAKEYYKTSMSRDYSKAYNSMANLYWRRDIAYDDVVKDIKDIIQLYESAIQRGNTHAYINLGHIFSSDEYKCKDVYKAKDYYEKASERRSELAKYFLARLYMKNRDIFYEINDLHLVDMFIDMTKYKNFKYMGRVYECLGVLLKQNGLLESEISTKLKIPKDRGGLIDQLNKLAWENGNREVIYDLAISAYINEENYLLKFSAALYYLNYRNTVDISIETKRNCEMLYKYIIKQLEGEGAD